MLASFSVICFADLKKYKFTYHFGFPAIHLESSWNTIADTAVNTTDNQQDGEREGSKPFLTSDETIALVDCVQTWRYSVDARQYGFFLAKKVRNPWGQDASQVGQKKPDDQSRVRPTTPGTPAQTLGFSWVVGSLSSFEAGFFDDVDRQDCFVCFADPSTYPDYPGWMLRNLLVLINKRWKLNRVQVMCYREVQARRHEARSIILNLALERPDEKETPASLAEPKSRLDAAELSRVTGWERNVAGKLASKMANLGEYMDPQR